MTNQEAQVCLDEIAQNWRTLPEQDKFAVTEAVKRIVNLGEQLPSVKLLSVILTVGLTYLTLKETEHEEVSR